MLIAVLLLLLGIALLYVGGEALVDGASALATRFGMSPLVIGLTVVAFGTSAPELAATLTATLDGSPELGFGNVVGSNIANIGLVLGAAALITALRTSTAFILRELPFMIGVGALLLWVSADGLVGRVEGLGLFGLLLVYLVVVFATAERAPEEPGVDLPPLPSALVRVGVGLGLLVGGAKVLVLGAVDLAELAGLSERVIGLTMVAVGTSLPELASSLVAARRGEAEMVLGNVVGSNIFNVLCILGLVSAIQPVAVDAAAVRPDLWVMLALSAIVVPFIWSGRQLGRPQGVALLVAFVAWLVWLFVR